MFTKCFIQCLRTCDDGCSIKLNKYKITLPRCNLKKKKDKKTHK